MPHNNTLYYEFGPYRLELAQRVLTRTGEMVALTRKATEILIVLVTNAGQLVEKDELLKEVWPDTFVEDSNLTQAIFLLRRTLGDERAEPKYIETVVRRGYRFVANVRAVHAGDNGSDSENALDGEAAVSPPRTMAVLPFVNATGDSEVEYLADGLTETFVNNLARVSKLRVMSRSAVFRYKSKQLDPRVVGRELGVGVVLVGRLTSHRPGISIGLELVEVGSGWQIWGENFECEIKDILEVQDAITRQLLAALKLKLSGDEEKRVTTRYTESAAAYQAYLEGRYHWSKYTRGGIEKAIIHFRQAIEHDPNYALSYAGIIDCYLRLATNYLPPEEDLPTPEGLPDPRNRRSCDSHSVVQSIEESRDITEAKVKLRFEWDWKFAERERHRAHELKYGYPTAHQWYAAYRRAKRLFQQASDVADDGDLVKESKLPAQIVSGDPSEAELLQILCAVARGQIAICNYPAAELVLKPWLQNEWPKLSSLTSHAAADLLFTLGLLTTSLATTQSATNGHRRAAALFNGSIALFEHLDTKSRSVEARIELARCYYRQGFFDLARETLSAALSELPDDQVEIKSLGLIYWGMLERDAGRVTDAISRLKEAAPIVDRAGPFLTVRYHLEAAGTAKEMAFGEGHQAYNDEAKSHYRSALYECEAVGDHRSTAIAENNLGLFLLNLQAWAEAEKHLRRSLRFFEALSDSFRRAQVNETLTRLYIATKDYSLAQHTIEEAIQTLELTDSEAVLSEALTTGGIVASRLQHFGDAQRRFEASYRVSERCGDREGARRALLSMFEEMGDRLHYDELRQTENRLRRLQAVSEPSPSAHRIEQAIAKIQSIIEK